MERLIKVAYIGATIVAIAAQAKVQTITSDNEFNAISTRKGKALIAFTAPWCTACNALKKPLEDISKEDAFADITFATVDVDQHPQLAYNNSIVGIPTFSYLENGHKKRQDVGAHNSAAFKREMRNALQKSFKKPDKKSVLLAAFTAKKAPHSTTLQHDETKDMTSEKTQTQAPPTQRSFWDMLKDITNWLFKAIKRLIDALVTPIRK